MPFDLGSLLMAGLRGIAQTLSPRPASAEVLAGDPEAHDLLTSVAAGAVPWLTDEQLAVVQNILRAAEARPEPVVVFGSQPLRRGTVGTYRPAVREIRVAPEPTVTPREQTLAHELIHFLESVTPGVPRQYVNPRSRQSEFLAYLGQEPLSQSARTFLSGRNPLAAGTQEELLPAIYWLTRLLGGSPSGAVAFRHPLGVVTGSEPSMFRQIREVRQQLQELQEQMTRIRETLPPLARGGSGQR